jgi:hypothetical protein
MTDQAARASFCSIEEREALLDGAQRERAALRAELGLPA